MRFFIISFFLASSFLFNKQDDSLLNLSKAHNDTFLITNIDQADTIKQNVDYKLLYDNQNIYIDRLLSTVYWALSGILGLIVIVVGSNLFLSYKFNKEKYDELVKSTQTNVTFFERTASKFGLRKIGEIRDECKSIIDKTIKEQIKLIDNQYSNQYANFTKYIKELIIDVTSKALTSVDDHPFIVDYDILKNKTILWVDDKPENNSQHLEIFSGFGVRFQLAKTTKEALEKLNSETVFNLIISNMGRPTDSNRATNPSEGIAFLEELKKEKIQTPVIIYTKPSNVSIYGDRVINYYEASITQGFTGLFKEILRKIGKYHEHMGK